MFEHFTFPELITGLCNDYQKLVKLNIRLTLPDNLPELPNELVLHFYRIVQELLTNAGKYAAQGQIEVSVDFSNQKLSLEYKDNGPGFSTDDKSRLGMGLKNIFERVKLVNGQADLDSSPGKGTRWSFSFPVSASK
jgi:two-component system NarL family sensor kinase